jgi:hypothetical protein
MVEGGRGGLEGDEVISVLFMVFLFLSVLTGRAIGNIYNSYEDVSHLSVVFHLGEEEIAGYIRDVLRGNPSEMEVGMALTLPSFRNVEGTVTELPDYARRWFISVSLSPIVVQQAEVSDVEITLWIEGEAIQTSRFDFEREKVPVITLLERSVTLSIEDPDGFREAVIMASEMYGGEVEFKLTGQALVHVLYLKTWRPFSTTRYPLVRAPHVGYVSSRWTDAEGTPVARLQTGRTAHVEFRTGNPTRVHSIHENVTVSIYREGHEEPVHTSWKTASVAPSSTATYVFRFTPEEPGVYYYALNAVDGFETAGVASPRLRVEEE